MFPGRTLKRLWQLVEKIRHNFPGVYTNGAQLKVFGPCSCGPAVSELLAARLFFCNFASQEQHVENGHM